MNTWKVVLATLVIFGTGVITGGLLVAHTKNDKSPFPESPFLNPPLPVVNPPGGTRPGQPNQPLTVNFAQRRIDDLLRRLEREVTLTSGQREKIAVIIKEAQQNTGDIWESTQPQLRREIQIATRRIREVLTEEQLQRFDALIPNRPQRRPGDSGDRRPREPRRIDPPLDPPPSPFGDDRNAP